jgi:hypothetical protein
MLQAPNSQLPPNGWAADQGGVKCGDAGVWWVPVFLDLLCPPGSGINASGLRAQCPDTKVEATTQYSAALPGGDQI